MIFGEGRRWEMKDFLLLYRLCVPLIHFCDVKLFYSKPISMVSFPVILVKFWPSRSLFLSDVGWGLWVLLFCDLHLFSGLSICHLFFFSLSLSYWQKTLLPFFMPFFSPLESVLSEGGSLSIVSWLLKQSECTLKPPSSGPVSSDSGGVFSGGLSKPSHAQSLPLLSPSYSLSPPPGHGAEGRG